MEPNSLQRDWSEPVVKWSIPRAGLTLRKCFCAGFCVIICVPYAYVLMSEEESGLQVASVKVKADGRRRQRLKEPKRMWRMRDMRRKEPKTLGLCQWLLWICLRIYTHTRTVYPNKSARRKLKQGLGEVNVSDEGHVEGLATADSSSFVLRDKKGIEAGWIQNAR